MRDLRLRELGVVGELEDQALIGRDARESIEHGVPQDQFVQHQLRIVRAVVGHQDLAAGKRLVDVRIGREHRAQGQRAGTAGERAQTVDRTVACDGRQPGNEGPRRWVE